MRHISRFSLPMHSETPWWNGRGKNGFTERRPRQQRVVAGATEASESTMSVSLSENASKSDDDWEDYSREEDSEEWRRTGKRCGVLWVTVCGRWVGWLRTPATACGLKKNSYRKPSLYTKTTSSIRNKHFTNEIYDFDKHSRFQVEW